MKTIIEKQSKTALITGASSGLGLHFAHLFARDGYNVVLVARGVDKLNALKGELEEKYGIRAYVFGCDLAEKDSAQRVYDFVKDCGLEIYALVNNAGFGDFGEFYQREWVKQYNMIQVNVTALTHLTRLFLPEMVAKDDGKILNVASIAAFEAGPLMSMYYASKAFVLSFTEALSVELKKTNVKVCALCPGPTETGFEDAASARASGLFKNLKVARADQVAEFGYKKLMKGRVVVIHGFGNKLLPFAVRFAPRCMVRNLVYKVMRARRERKD